MNENDFPEVVMPSCPVRQILKGQKALVTGANSGIGEAVAIALGHAGADVMVNYLNGNDEAEEVVKNLEHCGAKGITYQADVSDEKQVLQMFQAVRVCPQIS